MDAPREVNSEHDTPLLKGLCQQMSRTGELPLDARMSYICSVMTSSPSRHVIVVGAGPAGAVLSHLLATRGVEVTLLERQSDFSREFRGEALMPSGVDVLHSLKLDGLFERVPHATPTSFELYANRKRVFRLEVGPDDLQGQSPLIISQPALLEALVEETQRRSSMTFERGASVKELLHEAGRVVGVRVNTADGERRIRADLVIGCDGRASVVRRQGPLEVDSEDLPMDVVWCKLPAPANWKDEVTVRFCIGRGNLFICYIAYDGMLQTAWLIAKGSFGELRRRGVDEWASEMADHVPPDLSDHLREHADQLVNPFLLSTAADRVRNWSVPGALVLGDAAHTMSPVAGQGINIALRDAVVAANHLVPVLRGGESLEAIGAAAREVELERVPEVARVQAMQAVAPKVMLPRTLLAGMLRQLPKLMRFAPLRALAARGAEPMLNGTTDVTLRV